MVPGQWLLTSQYRRKVYVPMLDSPYYGGIVTYGGNKKGRIIGMGTKSIHPHSSIDDVLFVEGLKHNLLSISQLCDSGYGVPLRKMNVLSKIEMGPTLLCQEKGNLYMISELAVEA